MNQIARRITVCSLALVVATINFAGASAAFASPAASAAGGVSLQPAHPSKDSPSYFTFHGAAGTTITDSVVITNHATVPVELVVSPVDGLTGQTSGSVYANRQDPVTKAGEWVTPSVTTLTLPGQSARTVSFSVQIPAGTSAGDHLAGIAVENTQPTTSSNGFAIKQILRSVIGVLVVVPGAASFTPKLSTLGIQQIGATGIGSVTVGLSNSGLALAKPSLEVSLKSSLGLQPQYYAQARHRPSGRRHHLPLCLARHLGEGLLRRHRHPHGRRQKRVHEPHCRARRHVGRRHASRFPRRSSRPPRAACRSGCWRLSRLAESAFSGSEPGPSFAALAGVLPRASRA